MSTFSLTGGKRSFVVKKVVRNIATESTPNSAIVH